VNDAGHVPSVTLVVELEATPRIVFDAASRADRQAIQAWIREVRPDLYKILSSISAEVRAKKEAA
jgi:hypothetical protein